MMQKRAESCGFLPIFMINTFVACINIWLCSNWGSGVILDLINLLFFLCVLVPVTPLQLNSKSKWLMLGKAMAQLQKTNLEKRSECSNNWRGKHTVSRKSSSRWRPCPYLIPPPLPKLCSLIFPAVRNINSHDISNLISYFTTPDKSIDRINLLGKFYHMKARILSEIRSFKASVIFCA